MEIQHPKRGNSNHIEGGRKTQASRIYHKCAFPTHREDTVNHTTEQCKEFQKLPVSGREGKYEVLKQVDACFSCFGNHEKKNCPKKVPCSACRSNQHHTLPCILKPREVKTRRQTKTLKIKEPPRIMREITQLLYIPSTK